MTYRRLTVAETNSAASLNRRDFLKCRVSAGRRILELSCEKLYMRYQDARSGAGRLQISNHDDSTRHDEAARAIDLPKLEAIFTELERQLLEADELHLLEREWLAGGDFAREVGARIDAFAERGGRVELGRDSAELSTSDGASAQ